MQEILVRKVSGEEIRYARHELVDALLLDLHAEGARFFCTCQPGFLLEMHKCRLGIETACTKRQAGTGALHHPDCPSFSMLDDANGHGHARIRPAIQTTDGIDDINLELPIWGRETPEAPLLITPIEKRADVKVLGRARTTMIGMFRHIVRRLDLNRYRVNEARQENWNPIGKSVESLARTTKLNGRFASTVWVVPTLTNQTAVQRSIEQPTLCADARQYRIVMAPLTRVRPSQPGSVDLSLDCFPFNLRASEDMWRAVLKHADFSDGNAALKRAFGGSPSARVMVLARIEASVPPLRDEGRPSLRALNLELVVLSRDWILCDSLLEVDVVNLAVDEGRDFDKPLALIEGLGHIPDLVFQDTQKPCIYEILGRDEAEYLATAKNRIRAMNEHYGVKTVVYRAYKEKRRPPFPPRREPDECAR
ncbi:DUF1173 family protein [Lysobacter cavernae]|uniref:DUF1173 family protein n=1 Tax=Lysobacter cavernae TaxID=1685901 RepID=A0ABV7RML9_9GAMM